MVLKVLSSDGTRRQAYPECWNILVAMCAATVMNTVAPLMWSKPMCARMHFQARRSVLVEQDRLKEAQVSGI